MDQEFITFESKTRDGKAIELAVVDEFEYEHKQYVAAALVEGDIIRDDGIFIFRCIIKDDEVSFVKITNAIEYGKVAEAYMEMEE